MKLELGSIAEVLQCRYTALPQNKLHCLADAAGIEPKTSWRAARSCIYRWDEAAGIEPKKS
jgi:hypothetical protein